MPTLILKEITSLRTYPKNSRQWNNAYYNKYFHKEIDKTIMLHWKSYLHKHTNNFNSVFVYFVEPTKLVFLRNII